MSRELILEPTWPQYDFLTAQEKYLAFVAGFGSGKTEGLLNWILQQKLANPDGNVAYYAPTYDLIKLIAWPRLEEKIKDWGYNYTLNKSEKTLNIHGRGSIIFRTLDNPANIVGYEVLDSAVDELDILPTDHASDAFNRIVARNRSKKPDGENRVAIATTPEGFRFVYKRWGKELIAGHRLIRASTYSNIDNLPPDYIDNLRIAFPSDQLDAYIDGRFVNLESGNVYRHFDRLRHHTNAVIESGETLHIGMDFNINHMHGSVFVIRPNSEVERGIQALLLDEFHDLRDTPDMIEAIRERYPKHKAVIYPDATGKNASSKGATDSDVKQLKQAGHVVRVMSKNPPIKNRVACVNGLFLNDLNQAHLLVNTDNAPYSTEALEIQAWGKDGLPDKTAGYDHPNDATGYFCFTRFGLRKKGSTAQPLAGA